MTAKINYEFEVTKDNSALLAAINNLIHLHAQGTVSFDIGVDIGTVKQPEPVQPSATETTQSETEPEDLKEAVWQEKEEIDIPVLTEKSVIPEPADKIEVSETPTTADKAEADKAEAEKPDISPHLGYNDVKEAARDAKKTHGEKFAMGVLTDHGVQVKKTLGRSLAAIEASDYQSIVQAWIVGPSEPVKEEPVVEADKTVEPETKPEVTQVEEGVVPKGSLFDADETADDTTEPETEEEVPTIEPEAVKLALRAYAKKHGKETAKELMAKYGIPSLPMVEKADQPTLVDLFSKLL